MSIKIFWKHKWHNIIIISSQFRFKVKAIQHVRMLAWFDLIFVIFFKSFDIISMTLQSDESMMSSIIVKQFMFLGINIFWALHLRGHFNPRLAARAEVCVSLNRTLNTDMPANKDYCFISSLANHWSGLSFSRMNSLAIFRKYWMYGFHILYFRDFGLAVFREVLFSRFQ